MMASSICSVAILFVMLLASTESFSLLRHIQKSTRMFSTQSNPGEYLMSVDELKSELEMRGVSYDDCISKNELLDRLIQSRADGKASPDILKQFNSLDENSVPPEAFDDEEIMSQAVAKDGSLPGGKKLQNFFYCLQKITLLTTFLP
jgi:hypothetical protein